MSDFEKTADGWQRRFEDLIIEMVRQRNKEGLAYPFDVMPAVSSFNTLLEDVRKGYYGDKDYPALRHDLMNELKCIADITERES